MKVSNKTWLREFTPIEEMEAGVVLTGAEAKSAMEGRIKLEASFVKIREHEPFLINTEIFKYRFDGSLDYNPTRSRKLLLNAREILRLETKIASNPGLTIVPVSMYSRGRHIKVKIALVKGKKETEKRRLERNKEVKRQQEREAKDYIKS